MYGYETFGEYLRRWLAESWKSITSHEQMIIWEGMLGLLIWAFACTATIMLIVAGFTPGISFHWLFLSVPFVAVGILIMLHTDYRDKKGSTRARRNWTPPRRRDAR